MGCQMRPEKQKKAAEYFSNYSLHNSHAVSIDRDEARKLGLNILDLEDNQKLQDAILSVHHCALLGFMGSPLVKLIENHQGK